MKFLIFALLFSCTTPDQKPMQLNAVEVKSEPLTCRVDKDCWLREYCHKGTCRKEN